MFEKIKAASSGDYSGYGSIGRSNIAVLIDQYSYEYHSYSDLFNYTDVPYVRTYKSDPGNFGLGYWEDVDIVLEPETVIVIATCAFSYEQVYMDTKHPDFETIYDRLESYCVLDEDHHSQIQDEEQEEAWDSWVKSDVLSTLRNLYEWDDETDDYSTYFEEFESFWDEHESYTFGYFIEFAWDQNTYFEEDGTSGFSIDLSRLDWTDFIEGFYLYAGENQ